MVWKRPVVVGLLLAAALLLVPKTSEADPVSGTVSGCESCFGLTYTLTVAEEPGGSFTVTLTAAGTVSGLASGVTRVGAVAFKIGPNATAANLVSAPGNTAEWGPAALNSGINSGGCSGSGSGFVCNRQAFDGTPVAGVSNGAAVNYAWQWTGVKVGSLGDFHIKVEWENDNGSLSGKLISEDVNVPEPATMLLLGSGLLGVLGLSRRRASRKG